MSEINQSSKKIADIIGVIDEIAFQTNLLARSMRRWRRPRAGEQGRGFRGGRQRSAKSRGPPAPRLRKRSKS